MATDPTTLLAEKLRTLEARVARVEDQVQMVDKRTGMGLSLRERQVVFAMVVACILTAISLRARQGVTE